MIDQLRGERFGGINHRVARLDRPVKLQQAYAIRWRLDGKRRMTIEPARQPRQVTPKSTETSDEMCFVESCDITEAIQAKTL